MSIYSRIYIYITHNCQNFATPWTVAYQASPSMGFSRQECWSGLPFPSPGDLPDPGIEPRSPALQADALPSEPPGKPTTYMLGEHNIHMYSLRKIFRYFNIHLLLPSHSFILRKSILHFILGFLLCISYEEDSNSY